MAVFINRFRSRSSSSNTLDSELNDIQSQGSPVINEEQNYFIEAIRRSDLDAVKEFLDGKLVDVNSIDRTGRTGLQIAVQKQDIAMLVVLLDRGADIGNALLDAIKIESLECVAALVQCDQIRQQTVPVRTAERRQSQQAARPQAGLGNKILTPLVLAAQLGNFEITKFLMSHGYEIEKPHQKFCTCAKCVNLGRLGCYLNNLNIYRALVSPVYIALTFLLQDPHDTSKKLDPIYRAFVLKREILHHADIEFEFREDYLELAEKCEDFAVSLLDQCSDLEEISLFMTMPALKGDSGVDVIGGSSHQKILSVLNFAIKYGNKNFIAHRYSQVMLNSVVYHGLKGMEEHNFLINSIVIIVYWIFTPFLMLMYQFLPTTFWTRWLEVPMVKYISHLGSMVWFLCILIGAAFHVKLPNAEGGFSGLDINAIDVLVALWVLGILVEELLQAKRQGKERYTSQWWHLCTIAVVLLFVLTVVVWLIGYVSLAKKQDTLSISLRNILDENNVTPRTFLLVAHSLYSIALTLTFFQATSHFQVSYQFGPLHLSMMKMIVDVVKFFILFGIAYLAYCLGLRKLYSQYIETLKTSLNETSIQNTKHVFEGAEGTFGHLYWALFGLTETNLFETVKGFEVTQITGKLMFAAYLVTALVAVNLLIAMLTNTFQKVSEQQDVMFKVARTRILMQYVNRGSVTAPPFNLIPFKAAARYLYSLFTTCAMPNFNESILKFNEKKRNRVMRLLIRRYFMEKDEDQINPGEVFTTKAEQQPDIHQISCL